MRLKPKFLGNGGLHELSRALTQKFGLSGLEKFACAGFCYLGQGQSLTFDIQILRIASLNNTIMCINHKRSLQGIII